MRLILKGSSSSIRHKIKKEKNSRSSLFSTPSGARLRYLQLRNRVLNIDIPLNPPLAKGDFARVLANGYINKKSDGKTIGLLVVPPQGLEPWTPTLRVSCSTN